MLNPHSLHDASARSDTAEHALLIDGPRLGVGLTRIHSPISEEKSEEMFPCWFPQDSANMLCWFRWEYASATQSLALNAN